MNNLQNIGKFKINGKLRTIYKLKKNKGYEYYYRTYINGKSTKKILKKKPTDYFEKYSKYEFNSGSKKAFDVYIDKNPKDTITIKYSTMPQLIKTIKKLEKLFKNGEYSHKRIWQVGMILYVRLRAIKLNKKNQKIEFYESLKKRKELSKKYFNFLKSRTKMKGKTKKETFEKRKKMKFKFNKNNQ